MRSRFFLGKKEIRGRDMVHIKLMTAAAGFPVYILPDRTELVLDGIAHLSDVPIKPVTIVGGRYSC